MFKVGVIKEKNTMTTLQIHGYIRASDWSENLDFRIVYFGGKKKFVLNVDTKDKNDELTMVNYLEEEGCDVLDHGVEFAG
jgi:hypothetical protein